MSNSARKLSVSALLVGEYDGDLSLVHEVFRKLGWRLFEARDRRAAMQCLDRNPVQVVVAEVDVPSWGWNRVLEDLRRLNPTPELIVTSRRADDYLWAEVLNVGGYDVLAQPFDRDEVERVIAAARRYFDVQPVHAARRTAASAAGAA